MKKIVVVMLICSEFAFAQQSRKNLFGFATSNTFTYCDIKDTSFLNKIIELQPQLLRFPGGAVGNYYHYGASGYGFDFKEIDKYDGGRFPKRSRSLVRSTNKKGHTHNYIDDFIVLAKETNSKAVLVANMFIDNDDIIKMIVKIQSHNIEIVGVELGSELSNRTFFTKGYTIDKYIKSAKKCSDKIKQRFPDIKTAVVAAPLVSQKNHRHTIWNKKLATMNFYDAIIIHSYATVIKGKKEFGQMLTEIPEGNSKEEAFEIYKGRALSYFNEDYTKEVLTYNKLFNKPIWVTEWNLQISWTTGNTMLQSLFVANYFLELLWNSDLNSINLTTYHNMGGRDYSGSIFRINKDVLEMQSTYYSLRFIGQIFNVKNLNIKKKLISENVFEYFIFSNEELIYSCFLNWNSIDVIIDFEATKKINLGAYFSENLFDKANIFGELSAEKRVNQSTNSIKIKPNSVTLISYLNE